MKAKVGVWIDHKNAVIVILANKHEDIRLVESHVEKHRSRSDDSLRKGSYESQLVVADDSQQRSFTRYLNVFYDRVIDCIGTPPEAMLICGPGEAKGELKKRFERRYTNGHCIGIKTRGKMTHHQIVETAREYFDMQPGRHIEVNSFDAWYQREHFAENVGV
ncbi:hypothetical protein ACFL3D_00410 [Candidatus Omnitrophota bacterium]